MFRISVAVLDDFKRGDLPIELTSPSGTPSILLMPHPNDALPIVSQATLTGLSCQLCSGERIQLDSGYST